MSQFEHEFLLKTLFHHLGQCLLSFREKIGVRLCLGRTDCLLHTITLLMCLRMVEVVVVVVVTDEASLVAMELEKEGRSLDILALRQATLYTLR